MILPTLYGTVFGMAIAAALMIINSNKLFEISRMHFRWQQALYKAKMFAAIFVYFLTFSIMLAFAYIFWSHI